MSKFKVEIKMEVEGRDVDEALARAAVFMVYNMAGYRPTMTVKKQAPFEFPVDRQIDVFAEMHNHLFPDNNQKRMAHVEYMNILPADAFPPPQGYQ